VTLSEDLENIDMTWDDFGKVADDRSPWKSWVVQCSPGLR